MQKSREILKKFWGFDSFRPLQEDIVDNTINGHDTLAILPTGGGKSICFQVPGIALDGVVIVISPLIALMEDQVQNLQKKNIKANLLSGAMSYREIDIMLDNARFGDIKFLYTSPERLRSQLFIERFKLMNVALIVIDEAHCISEWGHDFRPSYKEISLLRDYKPNVPIIALTASATKIVQQDICEQLNLKKPETFSGSLERKNISYRTFQVENKIKPILDYCLKRPETCGIIYCQTRRSVKELAQHLLSHKISTGFYHGGLNPEDRKIMMQNWMNGTYSIMVATNAFGMGIDKPDVRFVLHYEIPTNLEAYYQEAGRAGRDGQPAGAISFWEEKDISRMKKQLIQKYPNLEKIKAIYNALCNFLQIAIGSGDQETYSFDIQKFCQSYDMNILDVYNSLKILQLNGNIDFDEATFHPTRIKFSIGNTALYSFQVMNEKSSRLITALTRSFPGIFDRFVRIQEAEIAKKIGTSEADITRQLKFLEQNGIVDVEYKSNHPKITFLNERLPEGYLSISSDIYLNRKNTEEKKLTSIIDYLKSKECRSVLINRYFGEDSEKCGTCDNCQFDKNNVLKQSDLLSIIPQLLPADIVELSMKIGVSNEDIKAAVRELIQNETVEVINQKITLIPKS